MQIYHTISTIFLSLMFSFLLSKDKRKVDLKMIFIGLFFQFLFLFFLLKFPFLNTFFVKINDVLELIAHATNNAVELVFGGLSKPRQDLGLGYILFFQGLPILITISALSSLLIYWRILPIVIRIFSFFFSKIFRIRDILGFAVSTNIFSGMSETPLMIRSYLNHLTHSEIFSLMVCGVSATSSTVMVLYSVILKPIYTNALNHIVISVLTSIPASLLISRIIIPPIDNEPAITSLDIPRKRNALEALYVGIMDGSKAVVTLVAMLIGFIAVINVFNLVLATFSPLGYSLTLQKILGSLMYPVVWIIGIPLKDAGISASLLGTKLILNELVALQDFATIGSKLTNRTIVMMIYLLCSFANMGSIGIMIGVYGSLIPERKMEIIDLGIKSVFAGTLANLSTASIVGLLLV